MNQDKATWLITGTLLVLAASSLMSFQSGAGALIPTPALQFLLWLATSSGYVLFLPAAYALGLYLLWDSKSFGRSVLVLTLVIAALSVAWFVGSWKDGISFPGAEFTHGVALENGVGLAAAVGLALLGVLRASRPYTASAHLAIFVVLAWCAFPVLGRLDL